MVKNPGPKPMTKDDVIERIIDITKNTTRQQEIHRSAVKVHEFIKGNQWITVSEVGHITEIMRDEEYYREHRKYRPREINNLIFPIYKMFMAYLIKAKPQISAIPESSEDVMDIIAARIASKVAEYHYRANLSDENAMELFNTVLKSGTAYQHWFLNPEIYEADSVIVPPWQIHFYPKGAKKWQNVRGICWRRRMATSVLQAMNPSVEIISDGHSKDFKHLTSFDTEADVDEPMTTLDDYFELPNKSSTGCHARVASQTTFLWGPRPYDAKLFDRKGKRLLPFVRFYENFLSDELYGFSLLGMLLARQESHNEDKSTLKLMGSIIPKLFVDLDTGIDADKVINNETEVIEYHGRRGNKPEFGSPQIVSPALVKNMMDAPSEMEHTASMHESILRAKPPGSIQSGYGIERLQSKDELKLASPIEWIRIGYIRSIEMAHQLAYRYGEAKLKSILGEMGEIDILWFKDIKLKPMYFNIEETTFSPLAQDAQRYKITNALQYGLINIADPRERRTALKYYDRNLALDFDTLVQEERLQKYENSLMLQGEDVDINPDDKDDVHLEILAVIMKDIRYRTFKQKTKDRFYAHWLLHKKAMQKKTADQIKFMQQIAQGRPQEPGAQAGPGGPGPGPAALGMGG